MKLCREHVDYISSTVSTLDSYIIELLKPYENLIFLASDVPDITENSARYIIAEIGTDMTVFKSSKHLCSWAGLTPQNNERPKKRNPSEAQEPWYI